MRLRAPVARFVSSLSPAFDRWAWVGCLTQTFPVSWSIASSTLQDLPERLRKVIGMDLEWSLSCDRLEAPSQFLPVAPGRGLVVIPVQYHANCSVCQIPDYHELIYRRPRQ